MKHFLPVKFFHLLVLCLLLCQHSFGADVTLNSFSAYKVVNGYTVTPSSSTFSPLEVVTTGTQIKVDITLERPTGSRAATGIYLIIGGSDISYMVGQNTPFNPTQTTANRSNFVASFNENAARAYWRTDLANTSREIQEIGNHPSFLFSLGTSNPNAYSSGGYLNSRYLHLVFCDLSTFKVTAVSKAGILLNFVNPPPPSSSPQPVINSISAASGVASDAIKLFGSGFTGITKVWFPTTINRNIPFTVVSDSEIRLNVPTSAAKGLVQIFVNNKSYISNNIDFTVLSPSTPPTLLTFRNDFDQYNNIYALVNVALPGDLIRLYLKNPSPGIWDYDIVAVDFNGVRVPASDLIYYSDYVLRVRVPSGITPGPITIVTASSGSSNGVAYRFPRAQSDCGDAICANQAVLSGTTPAPLRGRLLATGPVAVATLHPSVGTQPSPIDFPAMTNGLAYDEYKFYSTQGTQSGPYFQNAPIFASDDEEEQAQWQYSYTNNGGDWQDVPGATSRDYQPGPATRTTYYRRVSTHSISGGRREFWYTSNTVSITPYASIAQGDYLLRNRWSGQVIEIGGGGNVPDTQGARANQWPSSGTLNQQWTIDPVGNGTYRIINKRSNKALEVYGGTLNDGQQIGQWDYHGGNGQLWLFQPVDGSSRFYTITNVNSGQVAEVGGGSPYNTSQGAQINQWPYYGTGTNHQEQEWELIPLPTTPSTSLFSGVYTLTNVNSNQVLEMGGNQPAPFMDGTVANQWTYTGTSNQHWAITDLGNGYYKIVNRGSDKALEVGGGNTSAGATINQWTYLGLSHQQWSITEVSPGIYSIINRNSNQAMEIGGGSTSRGASANQWFYAGTFHQQWYINYFAQNLTSTPTSKHQAVGSKNAVISSKEVTSEAVAMSVFPNPTAGTATVSYSLAAAATISMEVSDVLGRQVANVLHSERQEGGAHAVVLPALTRGAYVVRLVRDGVPEYQKLLVE